MGAPAGAGPVSDAAGRPAARPDAARSALSRFVRDRRGATAIEYALIAVFLSILIVAGVTSIGSTLNGFFQSLQTYL
jgi:pilus assembly protein Flp/PilA